MEPRAGKITEYRKGDYFLTIVEWGDGHCELEIHHCEPKVLFHSCDPADKDTAMERFESFTQPKQITGDSG